jgi:hypothetical protein
MPIEFAMWRLDPEPIRLNPSRIADETALEQFLDADISLLGLDVVVIGRQVITSFGSRVDLLAIDRDAALHVIELKRDKTPRDVIAQALDYGSWVRTLSHDEIADICLQHRNRHLEEVFADRFGATLPDVINQEHHLVIVASALDAGTERIVTYLSAEYGVRINVLFFQHFSDEGRTYLARSWLVEPSQAEAHAAAAGKRGREPWNGSDYYVSFGEGESRSWEDAQRFGFISGGGGRWYSRTLEQLQPGDRVFVCVPGTGYVGVGEVTAPAVMVSDFLVREGEAELPILQAGISTPHMANNADNPEYAEYLVRVNWTKTVPIQQAIWEKGMFANQNTACALRSGFTRERVLARLGIGNDDNS